jgi:hypothetical protein
VQAVGQRACTSQALKFPLVDATPRSSGLSAGTTTVVKTDDSACRCSAGYCSIASESNVLWVWNGRAAGGAQADPIEMFRGFQIPESGSTAAAHTVLILGADPAADTRNLVRERLIVSAMRSVLSQSWSLPRGYPLSSRPLTLRAGCFESRDGEPAVVNSDGKLSAKPTPSAHSAELRFTQRCVIPTIA